MPPTALETSFLGLDASAYELPPEVLERTPTPALVIYLEGVRANLSQVLARAGEADRWRPHVKTTKIPAVFAELVRAGVRNFKCATTREARHLLGVLRAEGVAGADVLLAYPLIGPGLEQLARLAAEHSEARISVLSEDPTLVPRIPAGVTIFVDVDPGMHRTGVPVDERAVIAGIARAAGGRFRGVHYYDGHLHSGSSEERRRAAFGCYDDLVELVGHLIGQGIAVAEIITSGTPTFLHALAYPRFPAGVRHRISPGTVVYHDLRSAEQVPDLDPRPAALLLTRVVSQPAPDIVTCDAGSKSLAADAGDPCAFALGHPELVALTPSEEHLPLRVIGNRRPARGETLLLVPRHVCPTVNLAEEALLIDGGRTRVVPVSARAHDLSI